MSTTGAAQKHRVPVPLTEAEKTVVARAARLAGLPLSQWMRLVVLPVARRQVAAGGAR